MRVPVFLFAVALLLSSCGSPTPEGVSSGPRIEAALAKTWPAAAPARQAVFSRDGTLLATSDASGLIAIRETRGWKIVQQLQHPGGATSVAFSRDGSHLFSGGYDGTIRDWDLSRRAVANVIHGPQGTVWTIDISPEGKSSLLRAKTGSSAFGTSSGLVRRLSFADMSATSGRCGSVRMANDSPAVVTTTPCDCGT